MVAPIVSIALIALSVSTATTVPIYTSVRTALTAHGSNTRRAAKMWKAALV
jgi:hypothetical protein